SRIPHRKTRTRAHKPCSVPSPKPTTRVRDQDRPERLITPKQTPHTHTHKLTHKLTHPPITSRSLHTTPALSPSLRAHFFSRVSRCPDVPSSTTALFPSPPLCSRFASARRKVAWGSDNCISSPTF